MPRRIAGDVHRRPRGRWIGQDCDSRLRGAAHFAEACAVSLSLEATAAAALPHDSFDIPTFSAAIPALCSRSKSPANEFLEWSFH
jgi:hypothetical protein